MSVHFKPLVRQVHVGSLQERIHLQESNCSTASGAGELPNHSHWDVERRAGAPDISSRWQLDSLHGVSAYIGSPHKGGDYWIQLLHVWRKRVGNEECSHWLYE